MQYIIPPRPQSLPLRGLCTLLPRVWGHSHLSGRDQPPHLLPQPRPSGRVLGSGARAPARIPARANASMKLHFCIPVTQQRPDSLGGRYVVRALGCPAGPPPGIRWGAEAACWTH